MVSEQQLWSVGGFPSEQEHWQSYMKSSSRWVYILTRCLETLNRPKTALCTSTGMSVAWGNNGHIFPASFVTSCHSKVLSILHSWHLRVVFSFRGSQIAFHAFFLWRVLRSMAIVTPSGKDCQSCRAPSEVWLSQAFAHSCLWGAQEQTVTIRLILSLKPQWK